MKLKYMKPRAFLLAFIIAFSLSACAAPAEDGPGLDVHAYEPQTEDVSEPDTGDARAGFDEFLDLQFKDYVTEDTITLHYTLRHPENFGIERMEPTLGRYGSEFFSEQEEQLKEDMLALKSFSQTDLSEEQQLIYEILEYYMELDTEFFEESLQYYTSPISPYSGAQAELPILLAEYRFYDESDVADYLALIKDIDRFFQSVLRFEREKADRGLFMSDLAVEKVIKSCNDFTAMKENNFLIEIFDERIDELGLSEDKKAEYIEENKDSILNDMIPAYDALVEGLLELKGTGLNEEGLCHFEQGIQYYEYLIKSQVGSGESVSRLAAMIDERLETVNYGMEYIIYNNGAVLDQFFNPDFGVDDPEDIIKTLKSGMAGFYPENAGSSHMIKSLHPSLGSSFPAAFYLSVPIDDYLSAVIYINNKSMSDDDLFPVLAHEGYPGHLYQDTYFKSLERHPLRTAMSSIGYIEGWATYSEINSYAFADFPEFRTELALLLGFDTEFRLGIQSRCDIGVNYEGWTLADLEEYLSGFGIKDKAASRSIYDYVVMDPSKTLRYYVGYLEFMDIYEYVINETEGELSMKDFHKCLLDIGPAPFFVVREAVEKFVS